MKPEKEIKIRHFCTDTGFYLEIWQTEMLSQSELYFGRETVGPDKSWYLLNDAPYGLCEKNCPICKHITLIVCDANWNELGRGGNNREKFPKGFIPATKVK